MEAEMLPPTGYFVEQEKNSYMKRPVTGAPPRMSPGDQWKPAFSELMTELLDHGVSRPYGGLSRSRVRRLDVDLVHDEDAAREFNKMATGRWVGINFDLDERHFRAGVGFSKVGIL